MYRFLYKSHNGFIILPQVDILRNGSMAYIFLPTSENFNVRGYIFKRSFNKENSRFVGAHPDPPFLSAELATRLRWNCIKTISVP